MPFQHSDGLLTLVCVLQKTGKGHLSGKQCGECYFATTLGCFKKKYKDIKYTWSFVVGTNVFKHTSVPPTALHQKPTLVILSSVRLVPR